MVAAKRKKRATNIKGRRPISNVGTKHITKSGRVWYSGIPIPPKSKTKFNGVSIGKDSSGYFCYTHRSRSKSYPEINKIPLKDIKLIEPTA